jgi:type IV pilus biogenesis protein CpaD/CtpE
MKAVLASMMFLMLAGCASQEEKPPTGPTKAEVKAREDFAKNLPKPPER